MNAGTLGECIICDIEVVASANHILVCGDLYCLQPQCWIAVLSRAARSCLGCWQDLPAHAQGCDFRVAEPAS